MLDSLSTILDAVVILAMAVAAAAAVATKTMRPTHFGAVKPIYRVTSQSGLAPILIYQTRRYSPFLHESFSTKIFSNLPVLVEQHLIFTIVPETTCDV